MLKSLFRHGPRQLTVNERRLVEQWIAISPNPGVFRSHIDNLKDVRRVKQRCQVQINRTRKPGIVYEAYLERQSVSVVGIEFRYAGSEEVALGGVSGGIPDMLTTTSGIWTDSEVQVTGFRELSPSQQAEETSRIEIASEALNRYSNERSVAPSRVGRVSLKWLGDFEWLLRGSLPEDLRELYLGCGLLRIGDFEFVSGPEIWVYPDDVCLPCCGFTDGRFMGVFSLKRFEQLGVGIRDQVFQAGRYYGQDVEAMFGELVRLQFLQPEDSPF